PAASSPAHAHAHARGAFNLGRRYVCVSPSASMLGPQPDPHHLVPPKEGPDGDQRQMGASDRGLDEVCLYQTAAGALYSEVTLTPTPPDAGTQGGGQGGNRGPTNTSSEGYGTEEDCVLSDPQGCMSPGASSALARGGASVRG
ncbi:hypothetical protein CRUP_016049, partial [Coryphaenoides rupestris]